MEDADLGVARAVRELLDRPAAFEFFQAVRLLERMRPESARVGRAADPEDEAVRFGTNPAISFPPGEIESVSVDDEGQVHMAVNFMGLTGPSGVLPYEYSLLLAERKRARDDAPAAFLDLFHHRMIALFYRAWRKYRFIVDREQGEEDRLAGRVLDLTGMGLESERTASAIPPDALVFYAGLLGPQPRGAAALETLLADLFGIPVQIEQYAGGWYPLPARDWCAVGDDPGPSNTLGGGAVVGDEVWDPQGRVRVRVGPLERRRFDQFLPGGAAHDALRALTGFYGHDQYEFELQLVLAAADVPGLVLDADDTDTRLGWSTWIRTAPRDRDADEATLRL